MNSTTTRETTIDAPADLPTITIVREFDAPVERLYRAWTDRDLVARWLGPASVRTRIEHWDLRTGGSWRYACVRDDEDVAGFFGSFHEIRPNERLVQTFTYEGVPDGVSLETVTFTALDGGRSRATIVSVVGSLAERNAILASGMDVGVREGFQKLDALLAEQS
jgi:uncharacterized protein YndB with AHSA1/START domain